MPPIGYDTECNAFTPSSPSKALRSARIANAAPTSPSRTELASHGIVVDADASDGLVQSLLEVVRMGALSHPCPASPSKGGVTGATALNMSMRLLGFGKSATCLGHDTDEYFEAPTDARTLLHAVRGEAPIGVCCSEHHGLLVSDGGEVLAWGEDVCGRLGMGGEALVPPLLLSVPRAVIGMQGITVTKVTCSTSHTLALSIDGDLYAWGSAANGLLGLPAADIAKLPIDSSTKSPYSSRPAKLEGFHGELFSFFPFSFAVYN